MGSAGLIAIAAGSLRRIAERSRRGVPCWPFAAVRHPGVRNMVAGSGVAGSIDDRFYGFGIFAGNPHLRGKPAGYDMSDFSIRHRDRPRELKWYHASAILYGDWGTSRFYVLGLAFFYSLYASFWYVLGVGVLVAVVGFAYTIVCRCFPDGGGVYSSAKQLNKQLAVVGALLLCADYIVTAALSAFDGMQYLGVPDRGPLIPICAIGAIILIGVLNYFGLRKVGILALIVAVATIVLTLVISAFSISHLATGWHRIMTYGQLTGNPWNKWIAFVNVVLALSGVEAVANMTGVMVQPVAKTARKTIIPVLVEVVIFNLLLAVGMNALSPNPAHPGERFTTPAVVLHHQVREYKASHTDWKAHRALRLKVHNLDKNFDRENEIQNAALRVMATDFVSRPFGWFCGLVFGLLLISAVNTAIGAMMSIQYTMSRDNELPRFLARLNPFGVPWVALIPAVLVPVLILSIFHNLSTLGDLYAIGVVGAIAINLSSTAVNRKLPLKTWERIFLGSTGLVMLCIEFTLAAVKHEALVFALCVLGSGLLMRFYSKQYPRLSAAGQVMALRLSAVGGIGLAAALGWFSVGFFPGKPVYGGWLAAGAAIFAGLGITAFYQYRRQVAVLRATTEAQAAAAAPPEGMAFGTPGKELDMSMRKILVATRGGRRLLEFAAQYAQETNAIMIVVFVRQLNLAFGTEGTGPTLEEDAEAIGTFEFAHKTALEKQVPLIPIYAVSPDVAYTLLDFAGTYGVNALFMGVSRRAALLRVLHGDTLAAVADQLPPDIPLLIHA